MAGATTTATPDRFPLQVYSPCPKKKNVRMGAPSRSSQPENNHYSESSDGEKYVCPCDTLLPLDVEILLKNARSAVLCEDGHKSRGSRASAYFNRFEESRPRVARSLTVVARAGTPLVPGVSSCAVVLYGTSPEKYSSGWTRLRRHLNELGALCTHTRTRQCRARLWSRVADRQPASKRGCRRGRRDPCCGRAPCGGGNGDSAWALPPSPPPPRPPSAAVWATPQTLLAAMEVALPTAGVAAWTPPPRQPRRGRLLRRRDSVGVSHASADGCRGRAHATASSTDRQRPVVLRGSPDEAGSIAAGHRSARRGNDGSAERFYKLEGFVTNNKKGSSTARRRGVQENTPPTG